MILELVIFRSPPGQDRAAVLEDAKSVIPRWKANPDLLRKHFLLGQNGEGAGVYIWPSVEAAQKAHDDHWRDAVIKRTGGAPTIQYFDLLLLVDNEHGQVTQWDADGNASPA
jgi:hypothetical protein